MSTILELIPRLLAYEAGCAQRCASHLQVAIQPHALVVCPLAMAGEDTTIHTVAWGALGTVPRIESVSDPRRRDDQFDLFAKLGATIEEYFEACRRAGTYPQLWVSASPAADHLDLLAERLRYNRERLDVKRFGELVSYCTDRYPVAGQQTLHTATAALRQHWASGQQEGEDEHLGTLLAWIEPPLGVDIYDAVQAAECLPMGVKTQPEFDHDVLMPLVMDYNRARREGHAEAELSARARRVHSALEPIVRPIYDATQRAVRILQQMCLPPLPDLDHLETHESEEFENFMRSRDAGYGLTRRDTPKLAVFRFTDRENAVENHEAALVVGDRVARAGARLEGRVLLGTVERPTATRISAYRTEYRFDLRTTQRTLHLRLRDELLRVDAPNQRVEVTAIHRKGPSTVVSLRILKGQRAVGCPAAGTDLEFTTSAPDWSRKWLTRKQLSKRLANPAWTHTEGTIPASPKRPAPKDPLAAVEALR
jgi:hypothetical protein